MPVAVASNTESPPGDPVCKARQVPVQGDVGNMVPPLILRTKETRLCARNENKFTLKSYWSYPWLLFHFAVNAISRNKAKNCPRSV